MMQADVIERLVQECISHFMREDGDAEARAYHEKVLAARFRLIIGRPAAYRTRFAAEPNWEYGETKWPVKDLARKERGFEEQALYAPALPSQKLGDAS
jgi:hypothetical protein